VDFQRKKAPEKGARSILLRIYARTFQSGKKVAGRRKCSFSCGSSDSIRRKSCPGCLEEVNIAGGTCHPGANVKVARSEKILAGRSTPPTRQVIVTSTFDLSARRSAAATGILFSTMA
jgi:hypothetical protein